MRKVCNHYLVHAMLWGSFVAFALPAGAIPVDQSIVPSSAAEREARLKIEAENRRLKAELEKMKRPVKPVSAVETQPSKKPKEKVKLSGTGAMSATPAATSVRQVDEPEMLTIYAGGFSMGCKTGHFGLELGGRDLGCDKDEKPMHSVIVPAFELSKYEITQGQWKAVMGSNPSYFKRCGDACPVEQVSWLDVQAFIQTLNSQTGKTYRLPTEAEWEYACRAGENHNYCGSDRADTVAWHNKNSSDKTHSVGEKQGNAFGLYDMSGNVWEWVADGYHSNYNGAPTDGKVWGGATDKRVVRGGSLLYNAKATRAANRDAYPPSYKYYNIGFRLARTRP